MNSYLEHALAYASLGWPVLPLHEATEEGCSCGNAGCKCIAKHPRNRRGVTGASTDEAMIREWWGRWPTANIGVATGSASGTVVDVDGPAGEDVLADHGILPRTVQARTGKGRHIWFRHLVTPNRVRIAPSVDIRNDGGYVVVPPSVHASGVLYEWIEPPGEVALAAPPQWLELMASSKYAEPKAEARAKVEIDLADRYLRSALEKEYAAVAGAGEGGRNIALNTAALNLGQLVAGGALDEGTAVRLLRDAAAACGLGGVEVERTIASGLKSGQARPRVPPQPRSSALPSMATGGRTGTTSAHVQSNGTSGAAAAPEAGGLESASPSSERASLSELIEAIPRDLAGAQLADALQPAFRAMVDVSVIEYEAAIDRIVARTGIRRSAVVAAFKEATRPESSSSWAYSPTRPHELARELLESREIRFWGEKLWLWQRGQWVDGKAPVARLVADACERASALSKDGEVKPYPTTTQAMNNVQRHLEIRTAVEGEPPCWLPVEAGDWPVEDTLVCPTCIINARTLERRQRTPRLFVLNCLGAEPQEGEPFAWRDFLRSSGIEPEDADTLQEFMGLLLVPDTSFQKILSLVGQPRSGKGTILRIIGAILGPAMGSSTPQALSSKFGLEGWTGKLAMALPDASWTGENLPQAVERLKSISGEDSVPVEPKGKAIFCTRLRARIILAQNGDPKLPDSTGAISSRILTVRVPASHDGCEDRGLEARLLSELPQILSWALHGLHRLRARGAFLESASSLAAKRRVRDAASPQLAWVAEECEIGAEQKANRDALWESWKKWAIRNGHHPGSQSSLYAAIRESVGLVDIKREGVRGFSGISLKPFYV